MFDRKYTMRLFWPVLVEQVVAVLLNFMATLMVRGVSQDAMAGVGLVGILNFLVMNAFSSVAAGVSVVVSHCIGRNDRAAAGQASSQSLVLVTYLSVAVGLGMAVCARPILAALFGSAEAEVLSAAHTFFVYSCLSMPFLALFSTFSGIIRATGSTRPSMVASVISSACYVGFGWVFINSPLDMGVAGAGLALVVSRMVPAGLLLWLVVRRKAGIHIPFPSPKLDMAVLRPILHIAVPSGLDSLIFNGGKLIVNVFLSGMHASVLVASSIVNNLSSIINMPGSALQIISVTLVGQAYGKGDVPEARRQLMMLTAAAAVLQAAVSLPAFFMNDALIQIFKPDAIAFGAAQGTMLMIIVASPFLWSPSFVTAQGLRAAGCPRFTMVVSIVSMFVLRVFGAWFFGVFLGMNLLGVWLAMLLDWAGRSLFFVPRMLNLIKSDARMKAKAARIKQ